MYASTRRIRVLAITLGACAILVIGGGQPSVADSNDGGPFSHTLWLNGHSASAALAYVPTMQPRGARKESATSNRRPVDAFRSFGLDRDSGRGYYSPRGTSRPSQSWDPYGLRWDGGN